MFAIHGEPTKLYIKITGDMKYLFAMMDDETRFLIAQEVAETKDKHDTRNLLRMSKELMGKKPMTFTTDGLRLTMMLTKKSSSL